MARLKRSLDELRIRDADVVAALGVVLREVVARNRIGYGIVYLQITRGVARRDHAFPAPEVAPSLVVTARALNRTRNEALAARGHCGRQRARQPLGPRRHQDGRPPAQRAGAAGGDRAGRARRLVRRQATAPSPKGRRPTPGSSRRPASWSRARPPITPSCAASPARCCSMPSRRRGLTRRGARLHARGGLRGARGFRHRGEPDRAAGGRNRRPTDRRRQARPGRHRAAARISPLRRAG